MKYLIVAFTAAFVAALALTAVVEAHSGNVRRSDCTHVESATGERHRHTGRPYCPTGYESFLTSTWMHH
jgi:hypothetical protein